MQQLSVALILFLLGNVAWGGSIAGVDVADSILLEDGSRLQLNGAGVRSKFFVKVYVGALYLQEVTADAEDAITMPGPKQVRMHFVYDEVARKKITAGWDDGFESNLSQDAFQDLSSRLDRFNSLFEDMRAGEEIVLTYIPARGTRVQIKGQDRGVIEGKDFAQALLRVWLGEEPADSGLKRAMLRRSD